MTAAREEGSGAGWEKGAGRAPLLVLCSPLWNPTLPRGKSFGRAGGGLSYFCRGSWAKCKQLRIRSLEARLGSAARPLCRHGGAREPSRRRPSPAGAASPFSLGRSPRCRMDCAPPPLLCSVIQTWKVNNTLTSSGVCVLLHGYFPEYLALSKRGALGLPKKGPGSGARRPRGGAAP